MATDEELARLEDNLRRLKVEYEAYFNGGSPRPPRDTLVRVENAIKKYSDEGAEMNFAQRFRFNQLAQRYAVHSGLWRRKLRDIEEGRAVPGSEKAQAEGTARGSVFRVVCSDPGREREKVNQLLNAFVRAKQQVGERADNIDPKAFARFVAEKAAEFRASRGWQKVRFSVSVENGKVKLKAERP